MSKEQVYSINYSEDRIPIFSLLILSTALFISILTEALPAGFLLSIRNEFSVSESDVGLWVTLYAIGSLLSAIPLTLLTQHWSRKKLLLVTLLGFTVSNGLTSITESFEITLIARLIAGIFAGLLWALAAGYASRMVAPEHQGRAITIVMFGVPIALSLGVPAGTFLGNIYGWRFTFQLITVISLALVLIGYFLLPEKAGTKQSKSFSVNKVLALPGMKAVLAVNFMFALGHNILYTFIAPYLDMSGNIGQVEPFLLLFGVMAVVSIFLVGLFIDKHLRLLVLISLFLFTVSSLILSIFYMSIYSVMTGALLWGLAFGGGATLFQTASAKTSGDAADVAQSLMVTVWNLAIAGGGFFGGVILESYSASALPIALTGLLLASLVIVLKSRHHGFTQTEMD
ncbi:MFS transporter [Photobacterium sp. GJ3]|uniref:MFS transporter n=1 Tax=Photobacterium sp. GJ3 TaxID=2829502 RepID=UPI001B8B64EA|nr:MFS transporter [Photobacterium sp. GJ3]QUJ66792.1 MFS transporter [Photobacterium sp. GJ3]